VYIFLLTGIVIWYRIVKQVKILFTIQVSPKSCSDNCRTVDKIQDTGKKKEQLHYWVSLFSLLVEDLDKSKDEL